MSLQLKLYLILLSPFVTSGCQCLLFIDILFIYIPLFFPHSNMIEYANLLSHFCTATSFPACECALESVSHLLNLNLVIFFFLNHPMIDVASLLFSSPVYSILMY